MSTYFPKPAEITHNWYLVDLESRVLGRAASRIAALLRGKEKITYTPNTDAGNFVIAINAEKTIIKGGKWTEKFYAKHTNYPSGLKKKTLSQLFEKSPEEVVYRAVKSMLPKNFLGDSFLRRLRVYRDDKHPHDSQKPIQITL